MKHIGREVDIDPVDQHYWLQKFAEHLKTQKLLDSTGEIHVNKLMREFWKCCAAWKLDPQHLWHAAMNKSYFQVTATRTWCVNWDKLR